MTRLGRTRYYAPITRFKLIGVVVFRVLFFLEKGLNALFGRGGKCRVVRANLRGIWRLDFASEVLVLLD